MKRLLLPLLVTPPLMALPLNNPVEPKLFDHGAICSDYCEPLLFDMFDLRFGFYGDYIFNTHMDVNRPNRSDTIRQVSVMTNAGDITLNWKCIEAFCTLGATKIYVDTNIKVFQTDTASANNQRFDIEFESTFSWSVGGRWAVFDWDCLGFGVEGQYFRTKPDVNFIREYDVGAPIYLNGQGATYSAWQVGAGVNYMMPVNDCFSLNPYVGAFWLDSKLNFSDYTADNLNGGSHDIQLFDLEKDRQYGWAFGLTIAIGGFSTLTGEARFAGEKAAFINWQFQY